MTKKKENAPICARLPPQIIDQLNVAAGKNRAAFIRRAIVNELNRSGDSERFNGLNRQIAALTERIASLEEALRTFIKVSKEEQKR